MERFSVCQFFEDDSYEYVCRHVGVEEASQIFIQCCSSLGARLGTTVRVIVTDTGDCTCFEWKFNRGITFPPDPPKVH